MREIKFKAWDKNLKKMLNKKHGLQIEFYKNNGYGIWRNRLPGETGIWKSKRFSKEEIILLQYTGLKDKNGKEIYEGDIIKGYKIYSEIYENSAMFGIGSGYGEELYIEEIVGEIKFMNGNFVLENKKCILHKTKKYQTFNLGNWKEENIEKLWQVEDWDTYDDMIEENGGKEEVLKILSEITIIGNIYENPELI